MEQKIIKLPWQNVEEYRKGLIYNEIFQVWETILASMPKKFAKYIGNSSPKLIHATDIAVTEPKYIPFRFSLDAKLNEIEEFLSQFIIEAYWKTDLEKFDWNTISSNIKLKSL